jgi:transcription initiation factor TFIID subunit 7
MSADSSQGAFRGLRSRTPHSPSSVQISSLPVPLPSAFNDNSRKISTTRPHSLSQDYSPRPQRRSRLRHVLLSDTLDARDQLPTCTVSSSSPTPSDERFEEFEELNVEDTSTHTATMSTSERPKLKLNFSKAKAPGQEAATSPAPQSALRTPSIKLNVRPSVGPEPTNSTSATTSAQPKKRKKATGNDATPGSSAKKRKQPDDDGSEDELARKPAQLRKLKLTHKPPPAQSPITPTLKLKYKGRVPKRPLGLGYDSELDDREADPTILESFILRMQPGPDSDYLRDAVQRGTIGVARSLGGADVQMKFLDRFGRRGLVTIRGQRWAATLVDLPCIVEGMKSWDKKGWVKSADICQMLLVLGKVQSEDQAKDFPLPKDVNPHTFQYAHGLTPPMRWVRNRRFARTNRTSVNAIEAVERKVNQLLAEDDAAVTTKFEVLDYDPEARGTGAYSSTDSETEGREGYNEEEDAEGDEVNGGYFDQHHSVSDNILVETPTLVEDQTPQEDDADDDFIADLMKEQERDAAEDSLRPDISGLSAPEGDTSIAIASTSPSAVETAAQTPAAAETSGADDDSEDFDDEEDESMDDEDREATAQKQKALDEIQELKEELRKQTTTLKGLDNPILRRKVITRIEQIEGDLETARKTAGLDGDAEDGVEEE